jgi:tripartite ATP-independent transporter DctM subunit
VLILCVAVPKLRGRRVEATWRARFRSLPGLIPPLLIFGITVGSIYAGIATPTEAAALGVLFALGVVIWTRRCSWRMLADVCESTIRVTGIGLVIVMAAYYLNFVMSLIGLTSQLNTLITASNVSPQMLLFLVIVFYVVLGMLMETLSLMIATVPFIAPVVIAAGYDPVWFGILIILLIETAMITPPVGTNLFVIQAVRGRGKLWDVIVGTSPFVITLFVMMALIVAFPGIALWLPSVAGSGS